mmetsp:Transcript_119915/g.274753  ORF Transcript_119915/g.274753 Transcript_119915/m.274753 type:complete len:81 (-) Transcript_119915:67-309(-)
MAAALEELLGPTLVGQDGNVDTSSLDGKTIGLYFSAHWCPPCRGFTPKLTESYLCLHLLPRCHGCRSGGTPRPHASWSGR